MQLFPLKSDLIRPGDSLHKKLEGSLARSKMRLRNRDIIAVASKVVAISEGRIQRLSRARPTPLATRLANKYSLSREFAQIVEDEAEKIYGGVPGALLTLKHGQATANAGVDRKNAPDGTVVLWPANPSVSAQKFAKSLRRKTGLELGVVIVDSRVTPLRLGTIGVSLASDGFKRVRDFRGKPDLYGRRAKITLQAVADGIAGAAQLLMGEGRELIPFVIVRGAPIEFDGRKGEKESRLSADACLFMSQIQDSQRNPRH